MSSIRELIEELGGISETARRIGSKPQTVHSWIVRGRIPYNNWWKFERICGVKYNRLRAIDQEAIRKVAAE